MIRRRDISPKGKLCYAYANKGHFLKSVVDEWAFTLSRVKVVFTPNGIISREINDKREVFYDVTLRREGFKRYHCDEVNGRDSVCFSFNVKNVQKFIKPVKKKESIILFVEREDPGKLWIVIVPQSNDRLNPRVEQYHVNIQMEEVRTIPPKLEDTIRDEEGRELTLYQHPLVIASSEFQKIKKLTSSNKLLKVNICEKYNYIDFCCDEGDFSSSAITLGGNPEEEEDDFNNFVMDTSDSDSENDNNDEDSNNPYEDEFSSDEEEMADDLEEEDDPQPENDIYSVEFNSKTFIITSKLSSLSQLTQFYIPHITYYPLKIQTNIGEMGVIQIFIKDKGSLMIEGNV